MAQIKVYAPIDRNIIECRAYVLAEWPWYSGRTHWQLDSVRLVRPMVECRNRVLWPFELGINALAVCVLALLWCLTGCAVATSPTATEPATLEAPAAPQCSVLSRPWRLHYAVVAGNCTVSPEAADETDLVSLWPTCPIDSYDGCSAGVAYHCGGAIGDVTQTFEMQPNGTLRGEMRQWGCKISIYGEPL